MSTASDRFAPARRDALQRIRARWGRERKGEGKSEHPSDEPIAMPFLELSDEDLDLALRLPTPTHLAGLKDALRAMRAERFAELEQPAVRDPDAQPATSKRRELLGEIASEHFRHGMGSWLTSIPADHGLSATPVEELEKQKDELLYRLKLLKTITTMMQHEADTLETQIKARRLLDRKEGNP